MLIPGSIVIVDVEMGDARCPHFQPVHYRQRRIGIHMTDIQTKPKARIIHTLYDIQQPLRVVLQNIFQHDLHAGIFFQKSLPKRYGLLHIPNRKIDSGIITAVDDHFLCAVVFCQINCLPVAVGCQLPGFFSMAQGNRFIIGCVEQAFGNALQLLFDHTIHTGKFLIHIPGGAVFSDLQAKAVLLRYPHRIGRNSGNIDFLSSHSALLAFLKRYSVHSSKARGIRQKTA